MPGEADVLDPPLAVDRELDGQLVAAQRVQVVELESSARRAPAPGGLQL